MERVGAEATGKERIRARKKERERGRERDKCDEKAFLTERM